MRTTLRASLFLAATLFPGGAVAGCPSAEAVATILFSGDLASGQITPYRVAIAPVGEETYPSDAEIRDALALVYPSSPQYWETAGAAPPFHLWTYPPLDFGAEALVDDRDGHVAFAGTVVWAGHGHVILPAVSTHAIEELAAPPADPPTVDVLANAEWDASAPPEWSSANLTGLAVEWLRSTDLGHALADCAPPWHAVGRVYTPAIGLVDPDAAELVILLRGRPGPPWGPVAAQGASWGRIKAGWR